MNPCTLKWIFIIFCLIIALSGLYLAFLREHKNIKVGNLDPQDGSGDLKNGTVSFRFAIGLVLIVIGILGGFFSIKNLPGCEPTQPNNDKPDITNVKKDSTKNDEDNIRPSTDSTNSGDTKKIVKPSKNDSTDERRDNEAKSDSQLVVNKNSKITWKVDEKIATGTRSVKRSFENSASLADPLTVSISGIVQYPVIDDIFERPDKSETNKSRIWISPYRTDKADFQVYINGQTNETWNFSFSGNDFDRGGPEYFQSINKKITFNKPKSEKITIEFLFKATTEEGSLRYKNAIIVKGFKIEILN